MKIIFPSDNTSAIWNLEAISLFVYFLRDLFSGALRYYTEIYGLSVVWFLPDILAFICLIAFVQRYIFYNENLTAALTFLYIVFALIVSLLVLGNFAAMASAFKMILPIFVGFCFCNRSFSSYKKMLQGIHILLYVSISAVMLSSIYAFPWVGFTYESFGNVREAGRLWWSSDEVRLSGLSSDSTIAGFMIMITFAIAAPRRNLLWCLIFGSSAIYTTILTTNKTSLVVTIIYLIVLVLVRIIPQTHRFSFIRQISIWSFASILIPPVLIIALSGIELEAISSSLFSIQDRINNSWQLPFIHMERMAPAGFLIGCGLGCFNYPHELYSPELADYVVQVDNFYLGTYLMFGIPSLIFIAFAINNLSSSFDVYKYSLAFVMNLFTITVLSYAPASALVILGVIFSDAFAGERRRYTTVNSTVNSAT